MHIGVTWCSLSASINDCLCLLNFPQSVNNLLTFYSLVMDSCPNSLQVSQSISSLPSDHWLFCPCVPSHIFPGLLRVCPGPCPPVLMLSASVTPSRLSFPSVRLESQLLASWEHCRHHFLDFQLPELLWKVCANRTLESCIIFIFVLLYSLSLDAFGAFSLCSMLSGFPPAS